jgi:nitrogenase molybdenum-iron protein alpha/beta subunit
MTELSSVRETFVKKRKKALTKINSFREEFERKEKEIRADLEEARTTWKEMSETFKWWQSLP